MMFASVGAIGSAGYRCLFGTRFGDALRRTASVVLTVSMGLAATAYAQVCGVPGSSGSGTISGTVNTYYQPTASVGIGATSISVSTVAAEIRGAGVTPTAGSLIMVIQMQGATIDSNNDTRYGDGLGTAGEIAATSTATGDQVARGVTGTPVAGTYEFARVTAYNAGTGVITIANGLASAYQRSDPTATAGRFRYQVILVPQYASATIASATPVTGVAWNGETGGVVVLDVFATTTFTGTGTHIDASAIGFRGGYGFRGTVTNGDTQYASAAGAIGAAQDTTKGEGIAGTPRHVWTGAASVVVSTTQGYPGGDFGRGAPGNAGGGGIGHNSGGGGGANGGVGGSGGATYSGDSGTTFIVGPGNARDVGGFGGAPFTTAGRVIMGGGGGAGDANGGGIDTAAEEGPGGVGGGVIFFSSGAIAATQNGNFVTTGGNGVDADADATGGGGAGGSVVLRIGTAAHTARINTTATGGNGGNFNFNGNNTTGHCGSSGGGGSGGVVRYLGATAPASAALGGGTRGNHIDGGFCLGTNGAGGLSAQLTTQPPGDPGFQCLPNLTISKIASVALAASGASFTFTVQASNSGPVASANPTTIVDTIPTGVTVTAVAAGAGFTCTPSSALPLVGNGTTSTVSCTSTAGVAAGATNATVATLTVTKTGTNNVTNTAQATAGDSGCPAAVRCTGTVTVNNAAPQLTVTKTASAASFVVGTPASYTLQVQNTGTAATTAASVITDTIPAGLTIGTLPAGCTAAAQVVTCTVAAGLAAAGSTSFVIPVTPTAAAVNPVVNTASVSGGGDPTCSQATPPARCSSTTNTPLNAPALNLVKTSSTTTFSVGVAASYTLTLSNTGTAATTAVSTITDTIPAGLTIGTLPAGCTAAAQVVTCTVAAGLAAAGSTSFVIPVTPTAAAGASVTNAASVRGGGDPGCAAATNPLPARCNPSITTTINAPQLTVTKTASAASFVVGTPASYTLQVQNTGTAATTAASVITDTIPAGLTIGTLPAGCTAAAQVVTCTVAAGLAAAGSTSFVIPVTPTAAAVNPVVNTASVSGGGDPTCSQATPPARCSSTTNTPLNAPALNLVKTSSTTTFSVGVAASYTLTLSNTGTAATTAVSTITDTIPAGLTIGTLPAGCTAAAQVVTCTVAAGLAAAGSTSFVIPVTPTAAAGASVTNAASVRGGGDPGCAAATNPLPARCNPSITTTINAPQLTVTKTASAASFVVGTPASYTLQVQNTGTAATTAASVITDTIPAGLTIGTLPAGCTAAAQVVTCTVAAGLAAAGSTSFVIPVTPTAAAVNPVVNTASVSGGGDPTCSQATPPARCSSTTNTPLNAPALNLVKTSSTTTFSVGVAASYTLTLSNTGTAATTAVSTITDTIPAGLTIGTLPAGCTAAAQVVTCTVAAGLAAAGSTSFVIPVTPTAAAGASVTNAASVRGGGDPGCAAATNPLPARCNPSITTTINAPQLTVTKTASAASFVVGTPASYTLQVQNTGTAATTAASVITDTIPAGLTIGTLPAGCTAAAQVVTCTVAAGLAAAGSTSFVIPVTPTAAAVNPVVNTASVSGGGDPTCSQATPPARCSSTTNTPLNAPALNLVKTSSTTTFSVGVAASYTLTLSNTGTAATTAVSTITDTIPAGLTIGTLPAGCTAAAQVVTCTVAAGLAAAGSTSFVIPVTPTAAAGASVTNAASVRGGGDPGCAAATNPLPARCNPSITTTIDGVDMTSAFTGLPTAAAPGASVTGTLTCTNGSTTTAATGATCTATGATVTNCRINNTGAVVTPPFTVPASGNVTCTVTAIAPTTGTLSITGTTSANNETNTTNNGSSASIPIIDAVNDTAQTITSSGSAQVVPGGSVLTSGGDTIGGVAATTANVTIQPTLTVTGGATTTGWTINTTTGEISAPANVAAGTYSVQYQICAPAPNATVCDTATRQVTVNAGTPPDLTPTFTFSFTAYTAGVTRDVIININEINNVATNGLVRFFVPFSSGFTYAFDQTRTTAYLFNNPNASPPEPPDETGLQNPNWVVTTTATGFLFASTTPIPAGGSSRLVITSRADVPGTKASITVNIVALSGGEVRTNNNAVVLAQSVQR